MRRGCLIRRLRPVGDAANRGCGRRGEPSGQSVGRGPAAGAAWLGACGAAPGRAAAERARCVTRPRRCHPCLCSAAAHRRRCRRRRCRWRRAPPLLPRPRRAHPGSAGSLTGQTGSEDTGRGWGGWRFAVGGRVSGRVGAPTHAGPGRGGAAGRGRGRACVRGGAAELGPRRPTGPAAPRAPPPHGPRRPTGPAAPRAPPPHGPRRPTGPAAPRAPPPHTPRRPTGPAAPRAPPPHTPRRPTAPPRLKKVTAPLQRCSPKDPPARQPRSTSLSVPASRGSPGLWVGRTGGGRGGRPGRGPWRAGRRRPFAALGAWASVARAARCVTRRVTCGAVARCGGSPRA
jgi:hypothetical protein